MTDIRLEAVTGQLNVPPREAARSILAANVGVTLMLIAEKAPERNLELSAMTRDAMIFAVSTEQARDNGPEDSGKSSVVVAAGPRRTTSMTSCRTAS